MRRLAWAALAVVLAVPAPEAASAGKPEKAKEPKGKAEAPGQDHAPGQAKAKKAEPPAAPEPRGKAHGVVRHPPKAPAPASAPPAAEASPPREGRDGRSAESSGSGGSARSEERRRAGRGKVTLCHATGSATNPFVVITVSVNATSGNGHGGHARDVIPAPAAGCPSGSPEDPGTPDDPGTPLHPGGDDPADDPRDPVPGGGGGDSVFVGQPAWPAAETASPVNEELPFTGLPLALLALLGASATGTGVLLRRKGRPSGSTAGPASR